MTLIKVTESKEAPPSAGSGYRHYLAGNTYGPDTDPPATPALVRRAIAEGWAEAWPLKGAVTDLAGNPIPRGPDGRIHGEPLRGLTDEQRAALPELLPQDADAPMGLAISTADYPPRALEGLPSGTLALSGEVLMPEPLPDGVEWIALPAGPVEVHESATEPQVCNDCGVSFDDPDVMYSHACVSIFAIDGTAISDFVTPADMDRALNLLAEPIAATDPADHAPEPEEQAPDAPVPDVPATPAEAPATPTKAGGKSTRKASRRGAR